MRLERGLSGWNVINRHGKVVHKDLEYTKALDLHQKMRDEDKDEDEAAKVYTVTQIAGNAEKEKYKMSHFMDGIAKKRMRK